MGRRVLELVGFTIAAGTIAAMALALMIQLGAPPVGGREAGWAADPRFFAGLLWGGCAGGFVCASIVAVRTAWSFYSVDGLAHVLDRKIT